MSRKKKVDLQEKEQGLPLLINPLHTQQIRDAISQQVIESSMAQLSPGLMVFTEEELAGGLSEDEEEDRAPSWELVIEGLQALQASGMKFPVFTPGEQSSGQVVFEFLPGHGVNSTIFGWLRTPKERNITLRLTNKETEEVFETWTMKAIPVAIALDELDAESKDPWCTTFQVSVRDIQIT